MREEKKQNKKEGSLKRKRYAKTPTVYQMEATECGAASLTMILGYYGRFMPLEQMRIETGVSRDGCNMKNIRRAAEKFGLKAKGLRRDVDGLFALPVPCIIHWNFNHFVVWEGVKGGYCYINDPGMGRRKLTRQEIDDCFTGIVLTFELTEKFEKTPRPRSMFSFLKVRLMGQEKELSALVILGLFLVMPGLAIPIFSQVFIDDILIGGNRDWMTALLAIMLGTIVFQAVFTLYRGILLQKLQNKMILVSAHKFLTHMFRLPISFYDQRFAGDLGSRVENNNNISVFLTGDFAQTILNIFVAVFYLVLLFIYSPILTVIGLAITAFNLLFMRYSANVMGNLTMKAQLDQGKLTGALFSGIMVTSSLKASGTENEYVSRLEGYYAKSILMEQKIGQKQEVLNAIPEVAQNITNILVMVVGGVLVIKGNLTAGMLVAYNALLDSFMDPVNQLAGFIQKLQTARADLDRVEDIMKYQEDVKFVEEEKQPLQMKLLGDIELTDISFGYNILEAPLVENFDFRLRSGSSIAFVGASGSGKSTVSKICSGLYLPWTGEIRMDGVPVQQIPAEVLASSIATVSQSITIFSGTVRDNLTMWNRFIPDRDIIRACKDACIHDVITSKPEAYDYVLTEGGTNLSGGQRQRLEIARALVTNPSILVMDEATSALDPIVEKEILDNIKRRGCTCIIVAHRLSAIRDCDEIIVMEHGKIVQRGTHDELAARPGHYQRLIQNI